jgi:hypothetical protein
VVRINYTQIDRLIHQAELDIAFAPAQPTEADVAAGIQIFLDWEI